MNKKIAKAQDAFGNEIVAGNLVIYTNAYREFCVGIFIRKHNTTKNSTVAIAGQRYRFNRETGTREVCANFSLIQAKGDLMKIENPVFMLADLRIKDAMEIVNYLKDGRNLPKDFDEKILWCLE